MKDTEVSDMALTVLTGPQCVVSVIFLRRLWGEEGKEDLREFSLLTARCDMVFDEPN